MNERRRPRPASAVLRGKIRQIEERMARMEDHLEVIRIAAARSRGLPIRLKRLERKAGAQVARVRRTLKDSVARLSRAMRSSIFLTFPLSTAEAGRGLRRSLILVSPARRP